MLWIFYYIFQHTSIHQLNTLIEAIPTVQDIASYWEALLPATCMPDKCFCEAVQSSIIRQPVNTFTNLAFIIAGILVIFIALIDWFASQNQRESNLIRSHWMYSFIYGASTVLVGIGSTIYHSTMSFIGQSLDIMGMYFVAVFMVLYNIARMYSLSTRKFLLLYLSITTLCFAAATFAPHLRRPLFIVMLVSVLGSDILARLLSRPQANTKYYLAAIVSLLIGCIAWILDIQNIGCNPTSLIQLHSIWHIGMGSTIFFLYLYDRSETIPHFSTTQTMTKEKYAC